jgi:hypothetical protein
MFQEAGLGDYFSIADYPGVIGRRISVGLWPLEL